MNIMQALNVLSAIGSMTINRYELLLTMSKYKVFNMCDEYVFHSPEYNAMRFAIDDFLTAGITKRVPTPADQPVQRKYYTVNRNVLTTLNKLPLGTKDAISILNAAGFTSLSHAKVFIMVAQGMSDRKDMITAVKGGGGREKPSLIYAVFTVVNGMGDSRVLNFARKYMKPQKGSNGTAIELNREGKILYKKITIAMGE